LAAGFVKRGFNWLQFEDDFDIIAALEGLVVWPGFFIREISNKKKENPYNPNINTRQRQSPVSV
jgi:hypothetical protein